MSTQISTPVVVGGAVLGIAAFTAASVLARDAIFDHAKDENEKIYDTAIHPEGRSLQAEADKLIGFVDTNGDGAAKIGKEIDPYGPGGAWMATAMLGDQILLSDHKGHDDGALDSTELKAVLRDFDANENAFIDSDEEQHFFDNLSGSRD